MLGMRENYPSDLTDKEWALLEPLLPGGGPIVSRKAPSVAIVDSQSVKTANHEGIRGYDAGKRVQWVDQLQRKRRIRLDIIRRCDNTKGFKILSKRWIVERTFGWRSKYRRMSKDYETTVESSTAMIHIAMTRLMLKRAARF